MILGSICRRQVLWSKFCLLIGFDELHFYVRNLWAKYILLNGLFTLVMFGEQKFWIWQPPVIMCEVYCVGYSLPILIIDAKWFLVFWWFSTSSQRLKTAEASYILIIISIKNAYLRMLRTWFQSLLTRNSGGKIMENSHLNNFKIV